MISRIFKLQKEATFWEGTQLQSLQVSHYRTRNSKGFLNSRLTSPLLDLAEFQMSHLCIISMLWISIIHIQISILQNCFVPLSIPGISSRPQIRSYLFRFHYLAFSCSNVFPHINGIPIRRSCLAKILCWLLQAWNFVGSCDFFRSLTSSFV